VADCDEPAAQLLQPDEPAAEYLPEEQEEQLVERAVPEMPR